MSKARLILEKFNSNISKIQGLKFIISDIEKNYTDNMNREPIDVIYIDVVHEPSGEDIITKFRMKNNPENLKKAISLFNRLLKKLDWNIPKSELN